MKLIKKVIRTPTESSLSNKMYSSLVESIEKENPSFINHAYVQLENETGLILSSEEKVFLFWTPVKVTSNLSTLMLTKTFLCLPWMMVCSS